MDVTDSKRVSEVADQLASRYGAHRYPRQQCRHCAKRDTGREGHRRTLAERHRRQSQRHVLVLPRLRQAHAGREVRFHREHRLDVRLHRQQTAGAVLLQRLQGRSAPSHEVARGRVGRARRARQRRGADLHRNPAQRIRQKQPADVRCLDRRYADGPDGGGRRNCLRRPVPGVRRRQPDDRKRRSR